MKSTTVDGWFNARQQQQQQAYINCKFLYYKCIETANRKNNKQTTNKNKNYILCLMHKDVL